MNYSLQRLLIVLGLIAIPFYEIILRALPMVRSVAPDSRVSKQILSLVFALSIGLLAVFQGTIKPFKNKFLLLIPLYLLFNLIFSPHVDMLINNIESGDFYFWKPFAIVLCFALMIIAVSSMEIDFDYVLKIMVVCAAVMSFYMILQKLGLDQFWSQKTGVYFDQVRGKAIGGNLGQPTIAASFILMMYPLAIYLNKHWSMILILIGILITGSAMAIIALVSMMLLFLFRINKLFIIPVLLLLMIVGIVIIKSPALQDRITARMDGRWKVWNDIYSDIHNGQIQDGSKFCITGVGFGRFPFIFPMKHNSQFLQAHNDIYEFIYDCGLLGGFLLLAGLFIMLKINFSACNPREFMIFLSFLGLFVASLGSFPFQLGAHEFYSAVLVGFLNNDLIRRT